MNITTPNEFVLVLYSVGNGLEVNIIIGQVVGAQVAHETDLKTVQKGDAGYKVWFALVHFILLVMSFTHHATHSVGLAKLNASAYF